MAHVPVSAEAAGIAAARPSRSRGIARHGARAQRRRPAAPPGAGLASRSSATTPGRAHPGRRQRHRPARHACRRSTVCVQRSVPSVSAYAVGAVVQDGVAELPLAPMTNPVTGEPGACARVFLDADGNVLFAEDRRATCARLLRRRRADRRGSDAHVPHVVPAGRNGVIHLGFAGNRADRHGRRRDGSPARRAWQRSAPTSARAPRPPSATCPVEVTRIRCSIVRDLRSISPTSAQGRLQASSRSRSASSPTTADPDGLIAAAVAAARRADVAVVVVGTNSRSSPRATTAPRSPCPADRTTSSAPSPRRTRSTIVIVNAGSPVLMPWRDEVAAVLLGYFPRPGVRRSAGRRPPRLREPGGACPPRGRPTRRRADRPGAAHGRPVTDGAVTYDEGIHIGYRGVAARRSRARVSLRSRTRLHHLVARRPPGARRSGGRRGPHGARHVSRTPVRARAGRSYRSTRSRADIGHRPSRSLAGRLRRGHAGGRHLRRGRDPGARP